MPPRTPDAALLIIENPEPAWLAIRLDDPETECHVCGTITTGGRFAIPIYEGYVLPNPWPGEWVGVPACTACFERQERLLTPCLLAYFRADGSSACPCR